MNDFERVEFNFDELIKTILILSLPAKKQLEVMGFGNIGDEMAIDFGTYYNDCIDEFLEKNFINKNQKVYLDKINKFLDDRGGNDEYLDFWLDKEQLSIHPDWETIRKMAKNALKVLNKYHLGLKVSIENKYSESGNNDLIEKNKNTSDNKQVSGMRNEK